MKYYTNSLIVIGSIIGAGIIIIVGYLATTVFVWDWAIKAAK